MSKLQRFDTTVFQGGTLGASKGSARSALTLQPRQGLLGLVLGAGPQLNAKKVLSARRAEAELALETVRLDLDLDSATQKLIDASVEQCNNSRARAHERHGVEVRRTIAQAGQNMSAIARDAEDARRELDASGLRPDHRQTISDAIDGLTEQGFQSEQVLSTLRIRRSDLITATSIQGGPVIGGGGGE